MKSKILFILAFAFIFKPGAYSQEDLLSLLGEQETTDYATAGFKTNRIINMHSFENTAAGVLDFKINHRFGFFSAGVHELFGLDQSSVRLAFDYGITDTWQIGLARSSTDKVIDGYTKYKFLRQSSGKKVMPVSAIFVAGFGLKTNPFLNEENDYAFSHRLRYHAQLIIGRKFNKNFSIQMVPGVVHRNLVATSIEKNDVWHVGLGFRQKLTKRIAINGEYLYVLPGQLADEYQNSISLGLDIETGGHVFQLHFTNSTLIHEAGFITETRGNVLDGDIRFGFNVSRVFTLN
jgi:opacity protein-like surface antigen